MKGRSLYVTGGRIIDAAKGIDMVGDVLIRAGVLEWVGENGLSMCPDGCQVLSAKGLVVSPGFIDLHCHLREPGFEDKETIATGTEAAARGGFTAVCCMPNTSPPNDSRDTMTYLRGRVGLEARVRVFPIGCVSEGRRGEQADGHGQSGGIRGGWLQRRWQPGGGFRPHAPGTGAQSPP